MKKLKFMMPIVTLIAGLVSSVNVFAQSNNAEHVYLSGKTGKWSVVITMRPAADAPAQTIQGLSAEREMVGDYCLHETMHPAAGAKVPAFKRIADLAWNVNEQRWDYMSIDTRITAGIMYFTYMGSDKNTITSVLTNFPNPGLGPAQAGRGQAVYARNVVVKMDINHDMVRQYWRILGKPEWLAVQYAYTRSN